MIALKSRITSLPMMACRFHDRLGCYADQCGLHLLIIRGEIPCIFPDEFSIEHSTL